MGMNKDYRRFHMNPVILVSDEAGMLQQDPRLQEKDSNRKSDMKISQRLESNNYMVESQQLASNTHKRWYSRMTKISCAYRTIRFRKRGSPFVLLKLQSM